MNDKESELAIRYQIKDRLIFQQVRINELATLSRIGKLKR